MTIDLSLYLVTDSTAAVLGDRDLLAIVEEALKGGEYFASPTVPTQSQLSDSSRCHDCPV